MDFLKDITHKGYHVFKDFVPFKLINRMLIDLDAAYEDCREIQMRNGLDNTENTVHHLIGHGASFLNYLILFEELDTYADAYFGGKYILNSFGGNLLSKGASYASHVHRDIRCFSGAIPLMLNSIVMLDDFTYDNGTTWLMHRGHEWSDKPTDEEFYNQSFQITGQAGDVVFFNSNLWHKAGENRTDKPRRSVTPMFSKPFIKQQFDYTQFCDETSSPWLKQVLGWNSRVPTTLDQWYQPKDKRWYRSDQG